MKIDAWVWLVKTKRATIINPLFVILMKRSNILYDVQIKTFKWVLLRIHEKKFVWVSHAMDVEKNILRKLRWKLHWENFNS